MKNVNNCRVAFNGVKLNKAQKRNPIAKINATAKAKVLTVLCEKYATYGNEDYSFSYHEREGKLYSETFEILATLGFVVKVETETEETFYATISGWAD